MCQIDPHPTPPLSLSIPLMGGNSWWCHPESHDMGRWEKPMWDIHPPFLPSYSLSLSLNVKPHTHNLLFSRVWPFCVAGMCSVFVTHTVCLISHIDEIPQTKICLTPVAACSCYTTSLLLPRDRQLLQGASMQERLTHNP